MKTRELEELLFRRYEAPKYLTVFDVPNGTGSKQSRTADAVAMGMWPSTSLALNGFELKVSRGDFLRELRHPMKSWAVSRFCDHWWMVTAPGICTPDELPEKWGLLEARPNGGSLRILKKAPKLDPHPITRTFLAGLMRRSNQTHSRARYRAPLR